MSEFEKRFQRDMSGIPNPHPEGTPSVVDVASEEFQRRFANYARSIGMFDCGGTPVNSKEKDSSSGGWW